MIGNTFVIMEWGKRCVAIDTEDCTNAKHMESCEQLPWSSMHSSLIYTPCYLQISALTHIDCADFINIVLQKQRMVIKIVSTSCHGTGNVTNSSYK